MFINPLVRPVLVDSLTPKRLVLGRFLVRGRYMVGQRVVENIPTRHLIHHGAEVDERCSKSCLLVLVYPHRRFVCVAGYRVIRALAVSVGYI